MQLSQQKIEELRHIVVNNCGVLLDDKKLNELGDTLLRLTRVALNSSAKRIESERRIEAVGSIVKRTRSNQQVCEIPKPAGQQGALLRPLNGAGTEITPRGSVFTFRPSARGGHLVTDEVRASSNPGATVSNGYTQPKENGYIVNPSCARDRVLSYIHSHVVAQSQVA